MLLIIALKLPPCSNIELLHHSAADICDMSCSVLIFTILFFFKVEVKLVRFSYICIIENTMCNIVHFCFIFYLSVDICFAFIFRKKCDVLIIC